MIYQPHSMLVTGGAGFIGINFIRYILLHFPNIHIINLDKLTYAASHENLNNLPAEQYQFIHGDITDAALVQETLEKFQIDTIVHFAAESHVDRSINLPLDFVKTNILGTAVLLEAARNYWLLDKNYSAAHCRFHHISTDEVYGSLNLTDALFHEKTAYQPRSPYSASKASADHLVAAYYHTYGLPITLSNCSNNYGPYQHTEKFIPTIIHACLKQQTIPIYGTGKNIRDWLYVEDHCRAIMLIIQQGIVGEKYHIGGENEWENIELAEHICQLMDQAMPGHYSYNTLLQFVNDRPGHDFRYAINTTKITQELGWLPQENFVSGLQKTIQHYLQQFSVEFKEN